MAEKILVDVITDTVLMVKAQKAYTTLSREECANYYETVKTAILKAYELISEITENRKTRHIPNIINKRKYT